MFLRLTVLLVSTFLTLTSGLTLPRASTDATSELPNPFKILLLDTNNPSTRKYLYAPPAAVSAVSYFPAGSLVLASSTQFSNFTLNTTDTTISLLDQSSGPDPRQLYMTIIEGPDPSKFNLFASFPPGETARGNYVLLNNTAFADQVKRPGPTEEEQEQIWLTLGGGAFVNLTDSGDNGITARRYMPKKGPGPSDDDLVERFQFVVLPIGADATSVIVAR